MKLCSTNEVLPSETNSIIAIKSCLSGQFKLPNRHHLVSAVYEIDASTDHSKSFTIQIQHCAHPDDVPSLSFAVVNMSQQELPLTFKLHEGGIFTHNSSYGSISMPTLHSVLLLAVVAKLPYIFKSPSPQYCMQHFYIRDQPHDWRLHIVISRDLEVEAKVRSVDSIVAFISCPPLINAQSDFAWLAGTKIALPFLRLYVRCSSSTRSQTPPKLTATI